MISLISIPLHALDNLASKIPGRYKFIAFLATCVVVAVVMTVISYNLYVVSGAASLDLSRPGYKQALKEVNTSAATDDYSISSMGPLTRPILMQFKSEFVKQTTKTKSTDAYNSEALNDDSLNLFNNVAGSQ